MQDSMLLKIVLKMVHLLLGSEATSMRSCSTKVLLYKDYAAFNLLHHVFKQLSFIGKSFKLLYLFAFVSTYHVCALRASMCGLSLMDL